MVMAKMLWMMMTPKSKLDLEQIDQLHNLQLCVHDQTRPFIDFSISSKSEQSEQVPNGDKHHV